MQDQYFEWDDATAAYNWLKHATAFETAREAFQDPFAVEWVDLSQDPNEERFVLVGMV